MVLGMDSRLVLTEFPADDPERARRFWSRFLGCTLEPRDEGEGEGRAGKRATRDR